MTLNGLLATVELHFIIALHDLVAFHLCLKIVLFHIQHPLRLQY